MWQPFLFFHPASRLPFPFPPSHLAKKSGLKTRLAALHQKRSLTLPSPGVGLELVPLATANTPSHLLPSDPAAALTRERVPELKIHLTHRHLR
jgi:hypothetical protein